MKVETTGRDVVDSVLQGVGSVVGEMWRLLGEIPEPARTWLVIAALGVILWLIVEAWWFGHYVQECGARLRGRSRRHGGWHCRKPVRVGGTCGTPGHGRWWVVENVLGVLFLFFLLGRAVGVY